MKKLNIIIIITLLGSMVLPACVDLEEVPESFLAPDQFYKSEAQANAAIIGIYDVLQSPNLHGPLGLFIYGDVAADNVDPMTSSVFTKTTDPAVFTIDVGNNIILDYYNTAYRLINRANAVVDRLPNSVSMDDATKSTLIGEAKFLRAYINFNLVRIFGDIVYRENEATSLEGLEASRTSAAQVYSGIIADLLDAGQDLGDTGNDIGRAHKWAAKALLAKVYLTTGQYADAATTTNEIINSGMFQLIQEYNNLFRTGNTDLTDEILFAVQYGFNSRSSITDFLTPGEVSSFNAQTADENLFDISIYETGDLRRDWTVYDSIQWQGNWINPEGLHFLKFTEEHLLGEVPEAQSGAMDYPILRYADVLLMNSEAIAMRDGQPDNAYSGINEVRNRAGLGPLSGMSQDQFLDALLHERRVELILEGHRWFDLKRFGKLQEVMSFYNGFESFHEYMPMPPSALIANGNLTQNEGY